MTTTPSQRAARHEAGHAVMAYLCGVPAKKVSVGADGSGYTPIGVPLRNDWNVMILLAGYAAESFAQSSDAFDWSRWWAADDFVKIRTLLPELADDTALRDDLFDRVCQLLWIHRDLLEAIAARLERDGCVSAESLAALCQEHRERQEDA